MNVQRAGMVGWFRHLVYIPGSARFSIACIKKAPTMKNNSKRMRVNFQPPFLPFFSPEPEKEVHEEKKEGNGQQPTIIDPVMKPIDQAVGFVAQGENMVNDVVSGVVNGVTTTFNNLLRGTGPQPYLETDPTGIIETASEGLSAIQDGLLAANVNIQEALTLDSSVARGLISLGEKGDQVCDADRGDIRMTVEIPGLTRQFNACIDTKTARTVAKQIVSDPIKPLMNAIDCGLSESLLKPVDHFTRDAKNVVASIIRFGVKPGDILGSAKNVLQNGVDIVQKIWAGSYAIWLNPDAITCFKARTSDVPYETIDIMKLANDVLDLKWIGGERMERTPFASKESRSCKLDL